MNGWTVIVPVKPWRLAKSRLQTPQRVALSRAFCLDVLDAITHTENVDRVVIVSAEPELVAVARRRGLALMVDRPLITPGQLDVAVKLGRYWSRREAPLAPVVVVPSDLPCLTPHDLGHILDRLGHHDQGYVPDSAGGTTLVASTRPVLLQSAYGPGSDERHARLGLSRLSDAPQTTRLDVDTRQDLELALALTVGPHTRAATRTGVLQHRGSQA